MDYQKLMDFRNRANPFAQFVGIVTTKIEKGYAEAELELRPEHLNSSGIIHGGVMLTLADVVTGSATVSFGYQAVTSSGEYHYLAPGKGLEKVTATARCLKSGRTLMVFDVEVHGKEGKVLGKGTFTTYRLADKPIVLE